MALPTMPLSVWASRAQRAVAEQDGVLAQLAAGADAALVGHEVAQRVVGGDEAGDLLLGRGQRRLDLDRDHGAGLGAIEVDRHARPARRRSGCRRARPRRRRPGSARSGRAWRSLAPSRGRDAVAAGVGELDRPAGLGCALSTSRCSPADTVSTLAATPVCALDGVDRGPQILGGHGAAHGDARLGAAGQADLERAGEGGATVPGVGQGLAGGAQRPRCELVRGRQALDLEREAAGGGAILDGDADELGRSGSPSRRRSGTPACARTRSR